MNVNKLREQSYIDRYISRHFTVQTASKMSETLGIDKERVLIRLRVLHLEAVPEPQTTPDRCKNRPLACFNCTNSECTCVERTSTKEAEFLSLAGLANKPKKPKKRKKNDKQ